jgi:tetratricopeptide (TPR) repeat protein
VDPGYRSGAVAEFQVGHLQEAKEVFQQALSRNPSDAFALYYMGRIACARREWEDAIFYLQCCLDADPSYSDARTYLALAEESAGSAGRKLRFVPDWPPPPRKSVSGEQARAPGQGPATP